MGRGVREGACVFMYLCMYDCMFVCTMIYVFMYVLCREGEEGGGKLSVREAVCGDVGDGHGPSVHPEPHLFQTLSLSLLTAHSVTVTHFLFVWIFARYINDTYTLSILGSSYHHAHTWTSSSRKRTGAKSRAKATTRCTCVLCKGMREITGYLNGSAIGWRRLALECS